LGYTERQPALLLGREPVIVIEGLGVTLHGMNFRDQLAGVGSHKFFESFNPFVVNIASPSHPERQRADLLLNYRKEANEMQIPR
jgi:hypothetical protein